MSKQKTEKQTEKMSILSKAQAPVVKSKAEREVTGDVAGFLRVFGYLAGKVRLSYTGFGIVAHAMKMIAVHEVGKPSSYRHIKLLPVEQQCLVTRKDGKYDESVVKSWEEKAPAGFADLPILPDADVTALVEEALAATAS